VLTAVRDTTCNTQQAAYSKDRQTEHSDPREEWRYAETTCKASTIGTKSIQPQWQNTAIDATNHDTAFPGQSASIYYMECNPQKEETRLL
jgi:hypothetical protein